MCHSVFIMSVLTQAGHGPLRLRAGGDGLTAPLGPLGCSCTLAGIWFLVTSYISVVGRSSSVLRGKSHWPMSQAKVGQRCSDAGPCVCRERVPGGVDGSIPNHRSEQSRDSPSHRPLLRPPSQRLHRSISPRHHPSGWLVQRDGATASARPSSPGEISLAAPCPTRQGGKDHIPRTQLRGTARESFRELMPRRHTNPGTAVLPAEPGQRLSGTAGPYPEPRNAHKNIQVPEYRHAPDGQPSRGSSHLTRLEIRALGNRLRCSPS